MKSLTTLLIVATVLASPFAQGAKPSSKKATVKVPTALPAYKGKTKVSVDFQQTTSTTIDGGVVLVNESVTKVNSDARELRKEAKASSLPKKLPSKKTKTTVVNLEPSKESDAVVVVTEKANDGEMSASTMTSAAVSAVVSSPVAPIDIATDSDDQGTTMTEVETKTTVTTSIAPAAVTAPSSAPTAVPVTTPAPPLPIAASSLATTDFEDRTGAPVTVTTITSTTAITHSASAGRSVFFEGGYLASRYDKLESDLKNGASTMSLSLGLPVNQGEIVAALDVAHGLDQAVTPQNTRMLALRGGAFTPLARFDRTKVMGGATVGFAGLDVRSYREVTATDFTIRQHAMGTVLVLAPEITTQFDLGQHILARFAVRYYWLTGQEDLTRLSALSASLGAGYDF